MRRIIAIAVAGAGLAGCSSFSLDSLKPAPPTLQVQLDSVPPGADAVTSLGPSCKTPCSVSVTPPDAGFSVTYNLAKFEPATVSVTVIRNPGDFATPAATTLDPNPVVAELKPAAPPPKPHKPARKKPKEPKSAAVAPAAAAAAGSPFPDPNAPTQATQ
jgi:hypothetical protein